MATDSGTELHYLELLNDIEYRSSERGGDRDRDRGGDRDRDRGGDRDRDRGGDRDRDRERR